MVGKLIVIEGMDGTGTTTQTKMVSTHLQRLGFNVTSSAEPTNSTIGQEIRRLLALPIENDIEMLTSLALCFAADRMQHVRSIIRPGLEHGDFVILDRYLLSSLVYQGLHLPTEFVREINRFAPRADLTIVLDLDPLHAVDRLRLRITTNDFYEKPATLAKLRTRYLHFAKDDAVNAVIVDAAGTINEVFSHIQNVLDEHLQGKR